MHRYKVAPGTQVDLSQWDANETAADGKDESNERFRKLNKRLEELQETLYAQGKHKILVVLQAMDTGGKDGAIRHVFNGVNPQGVKVISFKAPTSLDLAHDYLWRVHPHTPGNGEMVIFNRSHYEDVLIVRVHNLVPEKIWSRRYEHINAFEKLLVDEGTTILKFFLHISKKEQKERLQARLDDPTKHWKFNMDDLSERKRWDDYMTAYEAVLSRTSTTWAPWYIVPANKKWYRNWVISEILVKTLEGLNLQYPEAKEPLDGIVIE